MSQLSRRQLIMGGTAIAAAGLLPVVSGNPLLSRLGPLGAALADGIPRPEYLLRLSANENPYGPSRAALKAINAAMERTSRYSGDPRPLAALMAELEELDAAHIMVGSGSNEVLLVAALMAGLDGGSMVCTHPTFQSLPRYAERMGMEILRVPVNQDLATDLDAMRAAVRDDTRLVYLVNPNNPIPTVIEKEALRSFVTEMAERCLVLVDEAYHEYADSPDYASVLDLVAEGQQNLIVTRTASKIHGLAGLRVGFGYAHPELVSRMKALRTGDNQVLGLEAARASYLDQEFMQFSLRKNRESQKIVTDLLDRMGHRYVAGNTNFVFAETGMANATLREKMLLEGIATARDFPPFEQRWTRISLSKPEEMAYFAQVYERLFA